MLPDHLHANTLFPVFLKLEQLQTLIVGGGAVGLEKLQAILANAPDAKVTLLAATIREEIYALVAVHPQVVLIEKTFETEDVLIDYDIAIAATDNKVLNEEVRRLARLKKILVNVADTPHQCDFYLGSIVKKGNLKIAISTNGKSPTLAKRLKAFLEEVIPADINETLDNLSRIRETIKGDFQSKVTELNRITSTLVR